MDKILSRILVILTICALGLFVLNQVISYRYKVELIKTPCQLCAELNKNQSMCINNCFSNKIKLYPSEILGEWCGQDGFVYDLAGNKQDKKCNIKNNSEVPNLNFSNFLF